MHHGVLSGWVPSQMSMDGAASESSRPPSESGDQPSKEAHEKGRFKVQPLSMVLLYPHRLTSCS